MKAASAEVVEMLIAVAQPLPCRQRLDVANASI